MDKELIPLAGTGITLSPRGANIAKDLTFDQAGNAISVLTRLGSSSRWALADVIASSIGKWGEKYIELIEVTQMSQFTLANILSVRRRYPTQEHRLWDVSFSHYTAAAVEYIDDETRYAILQQAQDEGLSRDEVRDIVRGYGPLSVIPTFSKEAFVTRLDHLLSWAEANKAPDELMQVIRDMLAEFKEDGKWEWPK